VTETISIVRTRNGPMEVSRTGSGPGVLVVHGIPGSWRQGFMVAEDLSDRFTVVIPSRPGYGRTPLSTGRTPEEQADAYAALLDEMGIETVAVAGASGGGPSSLAFARRYPRRTRALVLACAMSPYLIEVPTAMRWLTLPRGVGEFTSGIGRTVGRRRLENERAVTRWAQKSLTPEEFGWMAGDPRIREDLIRFARTHLDAPSGLSGMRNDLVQVKRAKAEGPPAQPVTAPTLILHGDADAVVGLDHAHFHAKMVPFSTLEIFPGAGHVFLLTRRRQISRLMRRFFVDNEGPTPQRATSDQGAGI